MLSGFSVSGWSCLTVANAGVAFRLGIPPADVSPFIRLVWASDGIPDFTEERLLPDGCQVMVFNFADQPQVQPLHLSQTLGKSGPYFLAGPSTRGNRLLYGHGDRHTQAGILFQPGIRFGDLRIAPSEIRNQAISENLLSDLWERLYARLQAAGTLQNRLQILIEQVPAICNRLILPDQRAVHLDLILRQHGKPVKEVSKNLGYSTQYLNRILDQSYGMSLKELQTLRRMELVLRRMHQTRAGISLTEIAYETGYFDQAHFIHDCRKLTGLLPKELLRLGVEPSSRVLYL